MYQKIMVPLDGSRLAECVLPHVEAFIQGCQVHTVIFVRVIEPASPRFLGAPTATSKVDYEQVLEYTQRIEAERKSSATEYLQEVMARLKHPSEGWYGSLDTTSTLPHQRVRKFTY